MKLTRLLPLLLLSTVCCSAQTSNNYGLLFADGFPGSDIGAKVNAAFASVGCPAADGAGVTVEVANCPTGGYSYSTPIVLQSCAANVPRRILDLNGCHLNMTSTTADAIQSFAGTPSGYLNLTVRNGFVTGGLNTLHAQNAVGITLQNMAFGGAANCDVLLEDVNGAWTERFDIDRVNMFNAPAELCLTNNTSGLPAGSTNTAGSGSFLYGRIRHLHFQLGDQETGLLINGNNMSGGAQFWAATMADISYNIANSSNGVDVVSVQNGGSVQGSHFEMSGEAAVAKGANPLNCNFRVDGSSSINTPVNLLGSVGQPICMPASFGSSAATLNGGTTSNADDAFYEGFPGDSQGRHSKERRHVGSHGGYDVLDAASYDGANGGWQIFQRNTGLGSSESDTMAASTDGPILSVLDAKALGGGAGAVGVGPGFEDALQAGQANSVYNIATVTCSGSQEVITFASGVALGSTYNAQPAMVTGGTSIAANGSNGVSQTVPIYGHYAGLLTGSSGSNTATMFQIGSGATPCQAQAGGLLVLTAVPSASLDVSSGINGSATTNGGFRVGGHSNTNGGPQTATIFTAMNVFSTTSASPTAIPPNSCKVESFPASAQNVGTGGAAGTPLTTDVETGVVYNGTASTTGFALPAPISTAGQVSINFCNLTSASWTPPSGTYYVKADRFQ